MLRPLPSPPTLCRFCLVAPKRDRKLAKLDGILSDLRREKKTCRDRSFQQEEEEEEDPWSGDLAGANPGHARTNSFSLCTSGNGGFPVDQVATHPAANNNGQPCSPELPGFDSDEDSDEASANRCVYVYARVMLEHAGMCPSVRACKSFIPPSVPQCRLLLGVLFVIFVYAFGLRLPFQEL